MKARTSIARWSSLLAGLLVLSCAFAVRAEDGTSRRTMGLVQQAGTLYTYFSARDLVGPEALARFDSGLPQRIVVQHFVYTEGGTEPIAVAGQSCRIVFDLWQTVYRVEREVFGGVQSVDSYRTRAEVLERCLVFRKFPLGDVGHAGKGKVYVATLLELNPLSSATLARIRRWLARPRGDYNTETKSFFGSFVSLFVNDRIGSAERVLRLRSQSVPLVPWP
ncbi:MAG: hypothetical protein RL385_4862 [Pseudomonadota bacterium]|jgi:hypothetical protein